MENYPSFNPNAPKGMPKSGAVKNTQPMQQRPMAYQQQKQNQMYQPQKVMQSQYPQFNQDDGTDWENIWNTIKTWWTTGRDAWQRNIQGMQEFDDQRRLQNSGQYDYPRWDNGTEWDLGSAWEKRKQWFPTAVDAFNKNFK